MFCLKCALMFQETLLVFKIMWTVINKYSFRNEYYLHYLRTSQSNKCVCYCINFIFKRDNLLLQLQAVYTLCLQQTATAQQLVTNTSDREGLYKLSIMLEDYWQSIKKILILNCQKHAQSVILYNIIERVGQYSTDA